MLDFTLSSEVSPCSPPFEDGGDGSLAPDGYSCGRGVGDPIRIGISSIKLAPVVCCFLCRLR